MSKTKQWAENTAEQKVDNIIAKLTSGDITRSDARTQIYILIDLLRKKYSPDLVLFLDGINEKTAWLNKINNLEYNETNLHYNYFKFLDSNLKVIPQNELVENTHYDF